MVWVKEEIPSSYMKMVIILSSIKISTCLSPMANLTSKLMVLTLCIFVEKKVEISMLFSYVITIPYRLNTEKMTNLLSLLLVVF